MELRRFGLYLIPVLGISVLIIAGIYLVGEPRTSTRSGRGQNVLLLYCSEGVRMPVEGAGVEHGGGVVDAFQRRSGYRIEIRFGDSRQLLEQLKGSANGDLFLSDDESCMEEARRQGLMAESHIIAWLVPVILVRQGNPSGIERVADLVEPEVRLAVVDSPDPSGKMNWNVFQRHGIVFEDLKNIQLTGKNMLEVAQAVEIGQADAAIVWRPVAKRYYHNTEIIPIPPEQNVPSPVAIAIMTTSDQDETARRFVQFLTGSAGQEIFLAYHYDLEPGDEY